MESFETFWEWDIRKKAFKVSGAHGSISYPPKTFSDHSGTV